MGEKTNTVVNTMTTVMIHALSSGKFGEPVQARPSTLSALLRRGLIHRNNRQLTAPGYEVASLVLSDVKTVDELHAEALDDPRQREAPATEPSFAVGNLVTIHKAPDNWLKWKIVRLYPMPYPRATLERRHTGGPDGVRIYSLTVPLRDLRHVKRDVSPASTALDAEADRRIIERAKYNALRELLSVLDDWTTGARDNHFGLEHRGEPLDSECWTRFHLDDIRRMVNDAAREIGCREPYRPPVQP